MSDAAVSPPGATLSPPAIAAACAISALGAVPVAAEDRARRHSPVRPAEQQVQDHRDDNDQQHGERDVSPYPPQGVVGIHACKDQSCALRPPARNRSARRLIPAARTSHACAASAAVPAQLTAPRLLLARASASSTSLRRRSAAADAIQRLPPTAADRQHGHQVMSLVGDTGHRAPDRKPAPCRARSKPRRSPTSRPAAVAPGSTG